jgi:hypothetical protein
MLLVENLVILSLSYEYGEEPTMLQMLGNCKCKALKSMQHCSQAKYLFIYFQRMKSKVINGNVLQKCRGVLYG